MISNTIYASVLNKKHSSKDTVKKLGICVYILFSSRSMVREEKRIVFFLVVYFPLPISNPIINHIVKHFVCMFHMCANPQTEAAHFLKNK